MKIFILGRGKSGTTALLFKMAGGLPNCQAFSGGHPGTHGTDYENAIYKHTYSERKGKTFDVYEQHVAGENYDRKIWMARDPRDSAVSRMLYRWHKGHKGSGKQYRAHLELVRKKEKDPRSVPFHTLLSYIRRNGWPLPKEEVVENERVRYQRMRDYVASLGNEWFIFKYEDMIDKNYEALQEYLGFEIKDEAAIPESTGKAKVARKKAYGDWRHWYTEEDVELFKPAYLPYMETIGYDCDDWTIDPNPVIEPEFSSLYMEELVRKSTLNTYRSLKDKVLRLLGKNR